MVEQVSMKNTKAQILSAYERLCTEYEQLQAKHEQLLQEKDALGQKASVTATPTVTPKPERAGPETGHTVGVILDGLAALRAGFGGALNELSSQLTTEVATLEALRQQIQQKTARLVELYGITVTENTLDELIETYETKSRAFQEQMTQKGQAHEQELAQKREAWAQERKAHAQAIKERDERLKTERQRNAEEYDYNLDMERKLDAERYEQEKRARYRELEAFVAAKERAWAERECAIAEQEQAYQELKTRAESLPKEMEAAIKQAGKEGIDTARKHAKVGDDLLAKEEEGSRRVAELKIQSLQAAIDKQAGQIENLSAQLDAVAKQSQALAVKAIEGASRETSFQSIREIALEQAKRLPKGQ
jgi:hypothetical protein